MEKFHEANDSRYKKIGNLRIT